jgi:hypothetical protein
MCTCRLVDIAYTFYQLRIEVVRIECVARGRHVIASLEPQGVSVWGIHAWKSNKHVLTPRFTSLDGEYSTIGDIGTDYHIDCGQG